MATTPYVLDVSENETQVPTSWGPITFQPQMCMFQLKDSEHPNFFSSTFMKNEQMIVTSRQIRLMDIRTLRHKFQELIASSQHQFNFVQQQELEGINVLLGTFSLYVQMQVFSTLSPKYPNLFKTNSVYDTIHNNKTSSLCNGIGKELGFFNWLDVFRGKFGEINMNVLYVLKPNMYDTLNKWMKHVFSKEIDGIYIPSMQNTTFHQSLSGRIYLFDPMSNGKVYESRYISKNIKLSEIIQSQIIQSHMIQLPYNMLIPKYNYPNLFNNFVDFDLVWGAIIVPKGTFFYRSGTRNPQCTEEPRFFSDFNSANIYVTQPKYKLYKCTVKRQLNLIDIRVVKYYIKEVLGNNLKDFIKNKVDIRRMCAIIFAVGMESLHSQLEYCKNLSANPSLDVGLNDDLKNDKGRAAFLEEFINKNGEFYTNFGQRISIGSFDDFLVRFLKQLMYIQGKESIDGYISPALQTPFHNYAFHNEICLFNPSDSITAIEVKR